MQALEKTRKAAAAFDDLSFIHKKEYVEWVLQAKREETRERRIDATVRRLTKGSTLPRKKT